jgi:hypothetical protein
VARQLRRFLLLLVTGAVACDSGPPLAYVYSPSGLSLRVSPSLDAEIVDVLPYGAPVTLQPTDTVFPVVVDSISGQWLAVRSGLREGYVFDGYVTREPPPDSAASLPEGPLVRRGFIYGADLVSLRDRPSTSSGRLAYIEYRDSVQVLLAGLVVESDSVDGMAGQWVRVRWSGIEGYLVGGYLSQFRPLARPFSRSRVTTFRTAFVQGVDRSILRSAPDSVADSVGVLAVGDTIASAAPTSADLETHVGLPGRWTYVRSPTAEGYLFDAFLSLSPPPDSAGQVLVDPPALRYAAWTPGLRLWEGEGERIFARDFVHYGDSVLVLFGGRTSLLEGPNGEDAYVYVKTRSGEGHVHPDFLSALPLPPLGTPFRDYVEQTIGRADPGAAGDGVDTIQYNRGVVGWTDEGENGSTEQRFRLPGASLPDAFVLLRACRENAFFETASSLPTADLETGDYSVTVRLAPGGSVSGLYVADHDSGELVTVEAMPEGAEIAFGRVPQDPEPVGDEPDPDLEVDSVSPDTTSAFPGVNR